MPGMVPVGIGAVMPRDGGSALAVIVAGITTLISRLALPPNLEWERARARARSMVPDRATTRVPLRRFISRRGIRPICRVRRFTNRPGTRRIRRLNKPRGGGQRVKRPSLTAGYG